MTKPTLLIACSDKKLPHATSAFEIYQGGMFKLIRANLKNPLHHFNILILSAKYGLLDANDFIEPYEKRMTSRVKLKEVQCFAHLHRVNAQVILNRYAGADSELFVVMSNDYLAAFDSMCETPKIKKTLNAFKSVYISRKHSGIGVLRGRLKRILINATLPSFRASQPTLFRSGLSNNDELVGFSQAGCDLGSSLAYLSDIKRPHRLNYLIQAMENGQQVFLDNGMITEIGRGRFVSPTYVFERYISIVKSLKPSLAKHLSVVVPDDPFDCATSVSIVQTFKAEIKWLASRVNVILPIHRFPNVIEHAKLMMKSLDNIGSICVGIPCKESITTPTGNHPLKMAVPDIELLFSLKTYQGKPLFKRVHFLALSEKSRGNIFSERKLLSDIYGIEMSCDACRTTAIMGNNTTSYRAGSVALREIKKAKTMKAVTQSANFVEYDMQNEWDYPYIHERIMGSIDENITSFVTLWNSLMGVAWELDISDMSDTAAQTYCRDIIFSFPAIIEHEILDNFKPVYWAEFEQPIHAPTSFDARAETFTTIFLQNHRQHVQLELVV